MSSEYRKNICLALEERPLTPKQLSERFSIALSHVSNTLKDLEENDLVKCLTPNKRKYKLYELSESGEELLHEMRENGVFEEDQDE